MKIIFSPTKTFLKKENSFKSTKPSHLQVTTEILETYNVAKNEKNQAGFFYNGISFKKLDIETLDSNSLNFLEKHLIILSALYGELKIYDEINEYRLDFSNKDLYRFWDINYFDELVINLASNEFRKMIKGTNVVNIEFRSLVDGKLKNKPTYSKMLRGLMLRYICQNNITDLAELRQFNELGYFFDVKNSDASTLVFVKEE